MKIKYTSPRPNGLRAREYGILAVALVVAQLSTVAIDVAQAQAVTQAQRESGLYKAHQAYLARIVPRVAIGGQSDTLSAYAKKCDEATGIHVPGFNCDDGTEVPGQGTVPATTRNATRCDQPNVLNGHCDPGSKFQVLPGGTADAVAVAHCRKVGIAIAGSLYNDIAVIQHNKKNGATCFYQALTNLPGQNVPEPLSIGEKPWQPPDRAHWLSPAETEGTECTGCHDNGAFIRSAYLAQLTTPPHVLPNTGSGFDNKNDPVKYVGLDYATNRSWRITAPPASGDTGLSCTTCHRLAVPNRPAFGLAPNGTGAHFANVATALTQDSKHPHGPSSPIWMRPGQVTHKPTAEASATKFRDCAVGFWNSGFVAAPPGCIISPLGAPWVRALGLRGWSRLGNGLFNSGPAVASMTPNRLDVFARATDDSLYTISWTGASWTAWRQLAPEKITSDPAAVSWGPGRIDVFARGTDNQMHKISWDGSNWKGWSRLGNGLFNSGPAVASMTPNRLDVFARATDDTLYTISWTGASWTAWRQLAPEKITSDPAAVSWGPGRIDVFARGTDNQMHQISWNGSNWTGWSRLGNGLFSSGPAVASMTPNRLDVFARATDDSLYTISWTGASWTAWRQLAPEPISSDPAAVSWGPERIDVFARAYDNQMHKISWHGNRW